MLIVDAVPEAAAVAGSTRFNSIVSPRLSLPETFKHLELNMLLLGVASDRTLQHILVYPLLSTAPDLVVIVRSGVGIRGAFSGYR